MARQMTICGVESRMVVACGAEAGEQGARAHCPKTESPVRIESCGCGVCEVCSLPMYAIAENRISLLCAVGIA